MRLVICYSIVLSLGCFEGASIHDHEDQEVDKKSFGRKAENYFRKRCVNNEEQLEHLLHELNQVDQCLKKVLPKHTIEDDEGLQERCYESRKVVIGCLERLMQLLEPCLPPEEKYLPDFVVDSYKGFSKYMCEHIHVLTLDGLLETNMIKCLNKFTRNKKHSPHYLCYEHAKFGNHSEESPVTKKELCRDLDQVYDCYEEQFKRQCPDAPKAWQFESGLMNGLRSPCDKEKHRHDEEEDD